MLVFAIVFDHLLLYNMLTKLKLDIVVLRMRQLNLAGIVMSKRPPFCGRDPGDYRSLYLRENKMTDKSKADSCNH